MAHIVVQTDDRHHVLMDEQVQPVHMTDEHSSLLIIERMCWAVTVAEVIEAEPVGEMPNTAGVHALRAALN